VCAEGGCGFCQACRTAPLNGHADVDVVSTSELTYGVDDARELVRSSSMSPVNAPWHVIVIEDADRLTERAVNVLLKALEEPPPHTVWILCAPSVEDVLPTIVSRTRHVNLATPSTASVAQLLIEAYGVDTAMASFAARASQGHIGRARALAKDEHARMRRQEVLRIPLSLHDIPGCFASASNLLGAATDDAKAITEPLEAAEQARVVSTYGAGAEGVTKAKMDKLAVRDLLSASAGFTMLEGIGGLDIDIAGSGSTLQTLMSSLVGQGQFAFDDSVLKGVNLTELGAAASTAFTTKKFSTSAFSPTAQTNFNALNAGFVMKDGVAVLTGTGLAGGSGAGGSEGGGR
jgi:hypothetical protein